MVEKWLNNELSFTKKLSLDFNLRDSIEEIKILDSNYLALIQNQPYLIRLLTEIIGDFIKKSRSHSIQSIKYDLNEELIHHFLLKSILQGFFINLRAKADDWFIQDVNSGIDQSSFIRNNRPYLTKINLFACVNPTLCLIDLINWLIKEGLIKKSSSLRWSEYRDKIVYRKIVSLEWVFNFEIKPFFDFNFNYYLKPSSSIWLNNQWFRVSASFSSLTPAIKHNKYGLNPSTVLDCRALERSDLVKYYVDLELLEDSPRFFLKIKRRDLRLGITDDDYRLWFQNLNRLRHQRREFFRVQDPKMRAELRKRIQDISLEISKFREELWFVGFYTWAREDCPDYFYLQSTFDFRGRLRYTSSLAPLLNKQVRPFYYYGKRLNLNLDQNILKLQSSRTFNIISAYFPWIKANINIKYPTPVHLDAIFWLLIEVGKDGDSLEKSRGVVDVWSFLGEGLNLYKKRSVSANCFFTAISQYKLYSMLDEWSLNRLPLKKHFIQKDSTASVLQHLATLLPLKNLSSAKYLNLNSISSWYDTYEIIIIKFRSKYKVSAESKRLFTRKNLKSSIMTINYGSTKWGAFNKFLTNIKEGGWADNNLSFKNIQADFDIFYKFLMDEYETDLLFKLSSKTLLGLENNISLVDGFTLDLTYNKRLGLKCDARLKTPTGKIIRTSIIYSYKLISELDHLKRNRSFRANLLHSLDALFLRKLGKDFVMITIHDAFFIELTSASYLIDRANEIFKTKKFSGRGFSGVDISLNKSLYSLFILI